jgi:uncharacterized protein
VGVELEHPPLDDRTVAEMERFVREYLRASVAAEDDGSRMRWYPWHSSRYRFNHTLNVASLGSELAAETGANVDVVRVAALFHDVAKLEAEQETHAAEGARVAREYLEPRDEFPQSFVDRVADSVANHTRDDDVADLDPETAALIEADMLDKVGANGALLLLLRMGYESRTHMDAASMVERVHERGESVAERIESEAARQELDRRMRRSRWLREWLEEEVAAMSA